MMPWGHAAVGYLLHVLRTRRIGDHPHQPMTLGVVFIGTQFPDLIDKPLAWTFRVLPSGRSLAHSLLTATVVLLAVRALARRFDKSEVTPAFAVGYLSHIVGDALKPLLHGRWDRLTYLGWPLLPAPDYGIERGFLAHFTAIQFDGWSLFEAALVGLSFATATLILLRPPSPSA